MVNVLVVDDSAFMRNALTTMIMSDPEIRVIGVARDGKEAVAKVAELKPDIVTMDVEMPRMDGIEALRQIMTDNPVPVLMVSSLTTDGAKATLDAIDLGAVDFIPKNLSELSTNIVNIKNMLIEKIKGIGKKGLVLRKRTRTLPAKKPEMPKATDYSIGRKMNIVVIGTSTGGPKALQNIITNMPGAFPVPILVAQHMPPAFTGPFAERLNHLSEITVKEAEEGEIIKKGTVYIAPGRGHMRIVRKKVTETVICISEEKGDYIYKPSVDALMLSVADCYPAQMLGVILTGLGNDGEKGMKAIKDSGGRTIAESEESCVVYGMPKAVVNSGLADKIVPVDEVAGEIMNSV
ncbi:MAG: chemotaxis response regulator protein-glutamate methylesterase [Nitrospiraceae bacterium]|nr:MAG: chemotaxis response regulator protein-glutamate methylesterase [Nitrospiraceae bacterium]